MATAKDFTMAQQNTQFDGWNGNSVFGWMLEGIQLSEVKDYDTEKWVRDYVKGTIAGWKMQEDVKASEATIYKVWRSQAGEFGAIFNYIRERIEAEFPVYVA